MYPLPPCGDRTDELAHSSLVFRDHFRRPLRGVTREPLVKQTSSQELMCCNTAKQTHIQETLAFIYIYMCVFVSKILCLLMIDGNHLIMEEQELIDNVPITINF